MLLCLQTYTIEKFNEFNIVNPFMFLLGLYLLITTSRSEVLEKVSACYQMYKIIYLDLDSDRLFYQG